MDWPCLQFKGAEVPIEKFWNPELWFAPTSDERLHRRRTAVPELRNAQVQYVQGNGTFRSRGNPITLQAAAQLLGVEVTDLAEWQRQVSRISAQASPSGRSPSAGSRGSDSSSALRITSPGPKRKD